MAVRTDFAKDKLNVVIIGGSLAGLMCGIALKHAGHTVKIIERDDDERQSHMAGVCLGPDTEAFLQSHDRYSNAFSHRSTRLQLMKSDETVQVLVRGQRLITSWDAYYFRLRSLFDGYVSSYYPSPPRPVATDGLVIYDSNTEVKDMKRSYGSDAPMLVTTLNRITQDESHIKADLVIGADGPDSFVRSRYLPHIRRQYVGYITWRGVVPEEEVSDSTCKMFQRSVTVYMMNKQHVIMYTIPGPDGSLEPGKRFFNFVWYTNETPETLDRIMTDAIDGHRHHNIVPSGRVRKDVWDARLEEARKALLPAPFLEVITKIKLPFIQVITDFCSSRAAFENGHVLLIGDALATYRPHTAFSATQSAFHSLLTEEYVQGQIGAQEWEEKAVRYSRLYWSQARFWGGCYQHSVATALVSGLYFWMYRGIDVVKAWWYGEKPLFRQNIRATEE
ncbi:FAD/NAD(P)-binding domain-containing protein [Hypoxylon crocopeplum]|nr:FAD/NAD(P)-binding domain-containing protein [Hypoxylon crocopeplum]